MAEHVGRDVVEVLVHGLHRHPYPACLVGRGGVDAVVGHHQALLLPLLLHSATVVAQPHHHMLPLLLVFVLVLQLKCGAFFPPLHHLASIYEQPNNDIASELQYK